MTGEENRSLNLEAKKELLHLCGKEMFENIF
jgi:hypothetical protein